MNVSKGDADMKVRELLERLKDINQESEIYVRHWHGDAYGSADLEDYWVEEKNVVVDNDMLVIDIRDE